MKIAFTSRGKEWGSEIDPRFGRTAFFLIYDEERDVLETIDNTDSSGASHGAGPKAAQRLSELYPDVLITGNGPGNNAERVLKQTGIKIFTGAGEMKVEEAYRAFKDASLIAF
jgi:predicted Fe-Mo cluster-binding NifX family protein